MTDRAACRQGDFGSGLLNAVTAIGPMTGLWNVAGYPAASVPFGAAIAGLPCPVQIVAAPGGEPTLLGLAAQLERVSGGRKGPVRPGSSDGPPRFLNDLNDCRSLSTASVMDHYFVVNVLHASSSR